MSQWLSEYLDNFPLQGFAASTNRSALTHSSNGHRIEGSSAQEFLEHEVDWNVACQIKPGGNGGAVDVGPSGGPGVLHSGKTAMELDLLGLAIPRGVMVYEAYPIVISFLME